MSADDLDIEFEQAELSDLGDGRIVSDVHEVYRMKGTGISHTPAIVGSS